MLSDEEKDNLNFDIMALSMVGVVGLAKTMEIIHYYKEWLGTHIPKEWENVD